MSVTISNTSKLYGDKPAVNDLSLSISEGEFLVLLGPSGCGKTTTMRSVVGLETPDTGSITIGGQLVFSVKDDVNVPIHKRKAGMVFQSYAIWPHMTVSENVRFPLKMQKRPKAEQERRVKEIIETVGLGDFYGRPATNLSGGQMQRVALARSLVMEPEVMLLDEPLSNLDAKLRERLRFELKELHQRLGHTTIYVTHDQSEALAMADRIVVMNEGRIEQEGAPTSLYKNPNSSFVAKFLGSSNVYEVDSVDPATQEVRTKGGLVVKVPLGGVPHPKYVSIRPEAIQLVSDSTTNEPNTYQIKVITSNYQGSQTHLHLELPGNEKMFAVMGDLQELPQPGDRFTVRVAYDSVTPLEV